MTIALVTVLTHPVLAASGGSASVFAGTWAQSIAAAIVFLVLLAILWKFAWGRILTGLQDRENKIRQDLQQAQQASEKAQATLSQYQAKLAEAQAEARSIIDRSRSEAQQLGQQLKDDAQHDITQMRQRTAQDIEAARQQALSEIYHEVAGLSTALAGRILQRQIKSEDHQRLIDESLDQMAKARN